VSRGVRRGSNASSSSASRLVRAVRDGYAIVLLRRALVVALVDIRPDI
jgi:hypothetical protein